MTTVHDEREPEDEEMRDLLHQSSVLDEASEESFPASDAPAWTPQILYDGCDCIASKAGDADILAAA